MDLFADIFSIHPLNTTEQAVLRTNCLAEQVFLVKSHKKVNLYSPFFNSSQYFCNEIFTPICQLQQQHKPNGGQEEKAPLM